MRLPASGTEHPSGRPRVLVLTTTLPAKQGDGTPEFVLSLALGLAEDFAITILAPAVPGAPAREVLQGVEIRRFRYVPRRWPGVADGAILDNLARHPSWLAQLPLLLGAMLLATLRATARLHPQLIHAHWIVPAGLLAAPARALRRVPLVLTVHGADVFGLRGRAYGWLRQRVVRSADVVAPVSVDLATALGIPEELHGDRVVPMGVDFAAVRAAVGTRQPAPDRLLFVGRLVEKKGLDVLLRAIVQLPEATLVVGGDGPQRPKLQALAHELGVADRVRFRGQLSKRAVVGELRTAAAIVIPSRVARNGDREGTPVVLAEAVAAEVPIIASSVGGLAERIRPDVDGTLVAPGDVEALVVALKAGLADPLRLAALARSARAHLADTLDMRHSTQCYGEFYRTLLAARRTTPSR